MRDIDADMKAALLEEYEGYVRAGRTADAEQVARVLKDQYKHDVGGNRATEEPPSAPEKAEAEKPPEAAVDPKPRRTPRVKPAQGEGK